MTQPDDRELEQYLEGGSKLSRRYRDAGGETSPPDLDEAILARAHAELRRKPDVSGRLNRLLTPVALAASVVLGVNLAWNVYQAAPQPGEAPVLAEKKARDDAFVPDPESPPPAAAPAPLASPEPALQPQAKARAPAPQEQEHDAALAARQHDENRLRLAKSEERAAFAREAESQRRELKQDAAGAAAPVVDAAPAPSAALADAAPMSEAARIDHLINHVANQIGATFIRNGKEYGPAEAAQHLQHKREKAGDRVKTAEDFIRLCASHSYLSGEAYLIRFADGRTRTAEDVLREELARLP